MSNTDTAWRTWAERDPYYGVLTSDKFRMASIDENRAEFFETGEDFVRDRLGTLERCFGALHRGRALDFGCGVGRIALPLARQFDQVVGIDIAQAMLDSAKENATAMHMDNVSWLMSQDNLANVSGSFDFVNTYIVLQHIPAARGIVFMEALLDRVAPGGGVHLHFPIHRRESMLGRGRYWAQRKLPGVQGMVNLARKRAWSEPIMQLNPYPFHKVADLLSRRGFGSFVVIPEEHGKAQTIVLMARRTS